MNTYSLLRGCMQVSRIASHFRHVRCFSRDIQTAYEIRDQFKKIVKESKEKFKSKDPSLLENQLASSQADLPLRRMLDSYQEAVIPLGSDPGLRDRYINFFRGVRIGRILEDLDTMAGVISFRHLLENISDLCNLPPIALVTAVVDKIDLRTRSILSDHDLLMRGHVTWVGSSSIEVTMHVDQECESGVREVMVARFMMAARDPIKNKKAFVNGLELVTDNERKLFQEGEARKQYRKIQSQKSLMRVPPSEAERNDIHNLFLSTVDLDAGTFKRPVKPDGNIWMEDTLVKNVTVCFPEQRNVYGKIFGGFLMRKAFELAWIAACRYTKQRPFIKTVDDIIFKQPVEIGNLLYLSSQVVYTCDNDLQLRVHVEKVDAATGVHKTTNILFFTFNTVNPVPPVVPKSYSEFMMHLEGKRHYKEGMSYAHQ